LSPDGQFAATGCDNELYLWNMSLKSEVARTYLSEYEDFVVRFLTFSPDGKWVASVLERRKQSANRALVLWKVPASGGRTKPTTVWRSKPKPTDFVSSPSAASFSPDSRLLAVATPTGEIVVAEVATGKERFLISARAASAAWSDNQTIVTTGPFGWAEQWSLADGLPSKPSSIAFRSGYLFVEKAAYSRGASVVATCDCMSVRVGIPKQDKQLYRHTFGEEITGVAVSSEGAVVAVAEYMKGISLFGGEAGKQLAWVSAKVGANTPMVFSNDDQHIAWGESSDVVVISIANLLQSRSSRPSVAKTIPGGLEMVAQLTAPVSVYKIKPGFAGPRFASDICGLTPPEPPRVDLRLELQNKSKATIGLRKDKSVLDLCLSGSGALNRPSPIASLGVSMTEDAVIVIRPGETYSQAVKSMQSAYRRSYWLIPGKYTVHGVFRAQISSRIKGAREEPDDCESVTFSQLQVEVRIE
jgi:hypothetical protein